MDYFFGLSFFLFFHFQIGFMPQETALFDEFTIAETFRFYARLYRISDEEFKSKMKELQDVLDLPPDYRTCSTLR